MVKLILLLIYISDGTLVIEKTYHDTSTACVTQAQKRMVQIDDDPDFEVGLFAKCIPSKILEAKNEKLDR